MRNSDKVSFVCFSNGGTRGNGKSFGNKVRFTNDRTRYTKALGKIGVSEITWVDLPKPMTKAEALVYIDNTPEVRPLAVTYADAIRNAVTRLIPVHKAPKVPKAPKVAKASKPVKPATEKTTK